MTFALTSFLADGVQFNGPGTYRGIQTYMFTVTASATDVDFDLGDTTGTFWTAAVADGTYGTMASQVLTAVTGFEGNIEAIKSIYTPQIDAGAFIKVASLSATGTYTLDYNTTTFLPDYTFYTSGGTTAYTVFVDYLLQPNIQPKNLSYNLG